MTPECLVSVRARIRVRDIIKAKLRIIIISSVSQRVSFMVVVSIRVNYGSLSFVGPHFDTEPK